jgi:hypothetical protein
LGFLELSFIIVVVTPFQREEILTALSHDYPQPDALRVVNPSGEPILDATVRVFSALQYISPYDTWTGETTTDENGRWRAPIEVIYAGTYTVHVQKSNSYGPTTIEVVVEEDTPP